METSKPCKNGCLENIFYKDCEIHKSMWQPKETPALLFNNNSDMWPANMDKIKFSAGGLVDGQIQITGVKKDEGKPRWELVPFDAIKGVVEILTFGAKKYTARNWESGIAYGRVFGAIMRHLTAWWGGENLDPESGKSHLDHAMCELMFLSAYEKRGLTSFDDRPVTLEAELKANS